MNCFFIGTNKELFSKIPSTTIEEAYNYLKDLKIISLDIETTRKFDGKISKDLEGLDPYLSKIVMIQIGDENKQFIIDYREVNIGILLPILTNPDILIVGQNLKFEYKHLLHNENIKLNLLYDTMLAERILYNGLNPDCSLKALNKKYLNISVDKDTRLEFLDIGSKPFSDKQIIYGAEDILYPLKIRKKQEERMIKFNLKNTFKLEFEFLKVLADIEYKGMNFNSEIWLDNYKKNLIKFKEIEKELDEFVFTHLPNSKFVNNQLDLFSSEKKTNIQWTSSKQVIEFLNYFNICPQEVSKTTKKLSYTVNAGVLKTSLVTINKNIDQYLKDFILKYLEYKELEQSVTTFGKDFLKYINPITGRTHSNYNQIMDTGRISSSSPNLQNIPSDLSYRKAFDVPEGFKLINADYSGQEQIVLANKAGDKDIIKFYEDDLGDMHSFIASKIFKELNTLSLDEIKKNHKDKRQIAKAAGFAINYGGTGFTISKNLGIPEEEGNYVYEAYFKAFPGLNNYFNKVKSDALKNGYILIDPITNRKAFYYPPTNQKETGAIHRKALNFPIQGTSGSITKIAGILVRKKLIELNLDDKIFITNLIHDECILECEEKYSEQASKLLEECMEKAGKAWCTIVPLKAEAVITTFWNH